MLVSYGGDRYISWYVGRFGEKYVLRYTNFREAAIAGAAVGSAITGLRPIVDLTFMGFITIALDAIVNNGAKNNYMFGGGLKTPVTAPWHLVPGDWFCGTALCLLSHG